MPWALGRLWRGANLASSSIFFDHVLGDDHRLLEILAAMNDAMANRVNFFEALQQRRRTGLQVRENPRGGLAMLAKIELFAQLWPARPAEDQPGRRGPPIDSTVGEQRFAFRLKQAEFEAARTGVADENFHCSK